MHSACAHTRSHATWYASCPALRRDSPVRQREEGRRGMRTATGGHTNARDGGRWLRAKLKHYLPRAGAGQVRELREAVRTGHTTGHAGPLFANPFTIGDLAALDDVALREMVATRTRGPAA